MESSPVSHSGNWLSGENWGLFQSEMSCSIIDLLSSNYLQKGGHYQQRNCRREATIGILCTQAAGSARRRARREAMSLRWSGDGQTLGSAFGNSTGTLQSSHTLLSADRSSRKYRNSFHASSVRLCWSLGLLVGWNALYLCWPPFTGSYSVLA